MIFNMTYVYILSNIAYENIFCIYQLGVIYSDEILFFDHFKNNDSLVAEINEVFILTCALLPSLIIKRANDVSSSLYILMIRLFHFINVCEESIKISQHWKAENGVKRAKIHPNCFYFFILYFYFFFWI